jgi:hypothetical protein
LILSGDSQSAVPAERNPNKLPDLVQTEIEMACNLRSPMCPIPFSKENMDGRGASVMKPDTYREIIPQISDCPRAIGLTIMGEPLINKPIVEFVKIGKAAGHIRGGRERLRPATLLVILMAFVVRHVPPGSRSTFFSVNLLISALSCLWFFERSGPVAFAGKSDSVSHVH